MKCPKIDWCPESHYACNKFNKKNPMFFCHKTERKPYPPDSRLSTFFILETKKRTT